MHDRPPSPCSKELLSRNLKFSEYFVCREFLCNPSTALNYVTTIFCFGVATIVCLCRAIERYTASLKEDEGDEESMIGLAKTHLRRSAREQPTRVIS